MPKSDNMRIPFCPLPVKTAKRLLGSKLYSVAEPMMKVFPHVEINLKQAEFDITARDYLSIAFFSAIFMLIISYFCFLAITVSIVTIEKSLAMSFFVSITLFVITLFYIVTYPKLIVKKRIFNIERNLIYAVRHMYVQATSGVPVFNALVSVAEGDYDAVSKELKETVNMVNSGMAVDKALDRTATRNPSMYFRRIIWQISNGVKSGSDLGIVLKNAIDYLSSEQKIAMKRYGSQLNPLTLAYMMVAVIIPSLGVTFLIVLSSFSKVPIGETVFWGILTFLVVFQFMFLGIMKSKRPNII